MFLRPYPETDRGKWPMSVGGGMSSLWSRDGRRFGGLSEARVLFRIRPEFMQPDLYYTPWDIAADGRFIMARRIQSGAEEESRLIVVENFFEELKAKMNVKR